MGVGRKFMKGFEKCVSEIAKFENSKFSRLKKKKREILVVFAMLYIGGKHLSVELA